MTEFTGVLTQYFPFLAGFTGLTMMWGQIKMGFKKLFNLFVVEIELDRDASRALIKYLSTNARLFRMGTKTYCSSATYVKPVEKSLLVGYETIGKKDPQLYWLEGKPLLVIRQPAGVDNELSPSRSAFQVKCYLLRASFDTEELVVKALDCFNAFSVTENQRFRVRQFYGRANANAGSNRPQQPELGAEYVKDAAGISDGTNKILKWKPEDIGYGVKDKETIRNTFVFTEDIKELHTRLLKWKKSGSWYRAKGIPWRLGALLHGKPGSGKTFSVVNIAQLLDIPLYIFDLGSLSNQELIEYWTKLQENSPAIALFEDVDSIWIGRKNAAEHVGPTFDCFLNCLSGAIPSEGVFTVVTTNKVETLDEALGIPNAQGISTRPGRLDCCIRLNGMQAAERKMLADNILKEHPEHIDKMVQESDGLTAAQCAEKFGKLALELYWKDQET